MDELAKQNTQQPLKPQTSTIKKSTGLGSKLIISLFILAAFGFLTIMFVIITSIGIPLGDSYLDGVVVDTQTNAPVAGINVAIKNRGWGFDSGLVWDKTYTYSGVTDSQGKFHIVYKLGPSAHVVIAQAGFERFDQYIDGNTNTTITLKKTEQQDIVKTSTSDSPMIDWKTYINPTYNYSIKYPPEYSVPPQSDRQKSQLGVDNNMCVTKISDGTCSVVFDVSNANGLTLEEWVKKNHTLFTEYGGKQIEATKTTFNGYEAMTARNETQLIYYILKGTHIYVLSGSTDEVESTILYSFKFTDEFDAKEINNFPIFTAATFVKKENKCSSKNDCWTQYSWTVNKKYDDVSKWYFGNVADTGWSCNGGSGACDISTGRCSGSKECIKGNQTQMVTLTGDTKNTTIELPISKNP
jgi:hypothetical protein